MTAELLRRLLEEGRAKLEPFNDKFDRLYLRRPTSNTATMNELNRFFAEGAPEWSIPTLINKALAG